MPSAALAEPSHEEPESKSTRSTRAKIDEYDYDDETVQHKSPRVKPKTAVTTSKINHDESREHEIEAKTSKQPPRSKSPRAINVKSTGTPRKNNKVNYLEEEETATTTTTTAWSSSDQENEEERAVISKRRAPTPASPQRKPILRSSKRLKNN